jgi:hypothetical protein
MLEKIIIFVCAAAIIVMNLYYLDKSGAPEWASIMSFNIMAFVWIISWGEKEKE